MYNNNDRVWRTPPSEGGNRIKETLYCPLTGKKLDITFNYYDELLSSLPDFYNSMFDQIESGEHDCNIILKKAIVNFYEKNPRHANVYFMYGLMLYLFSFCRCLSYNTEAIMYPYMFPAFVQRGFLSETTYADAPEDFKQLLRRIRNGEVTPDLDCSVYAYNCLIFPNMMNNFAYAKKPDFIAPLDGGVAVPAFKWESLIKWLCFHVNELIESGELVISPFHPDGALDPDEYTRAQLAYAADPTNEEKRRKALDRPSRYGLDKDKESENKND